MNNERRNDTLPDSVPVLVVGAGPSGLMLSAELALFGITPLLIDAAERPSGQSRALGFTVRTLEIFQQRGILERFAGLVRQPSVHFAGMAIDGRHLSSTLSPANQYPQSKTEAALTVWAGELGVDIARPWRLESLAHTPEGYRCVLAGPRGSHIVTAQYVAGCDGAHSRVRDCIAMTADTTEPSVQMLVGDLRSSGLANNPFGVKHRGGMVMSAPLGGGVDRVIICDFSRPMAPRGSLVSHEEVKTSYEKVVGQPLFADECLWASSFTDASLLVRSYRSGGVFLVGDSAHTHLPAGGQGMNVGIQDAVNLGWKLAAACQGRASEALLDTYHDERHPVARRLLRNTAAQGQLFLRGPEVDPVREVLSSLLEVPAVATRLADSVSGLDVHYQFAAGDDSGLVGGRLPPGLLVATDSGADAIGELRHGTAVLFCLTLDPVLAAVANQWSPHLRVVSAQVRFPEHDCDMAVAHSLFVRPDGHIAWTGSHADALRQSLTTWLGQPTGQLQEV